MKAKTDLGPILNFLSQLSQNNNKAWFDRNRAAYDQARASFDEFVHGLIAELSKFDDLEGATAEESIFRINRDIRFSKDKTPYKTNMGAHIVRGGRKSERLGYYVHIAPGDQSLLAGGLHMPTTGQRASFRSAIAQDARPFKKIIQARDFRRYFGGLEGERLRTAPQGYARDHPEIQLLQLKQVTVSHHLTDRELLVPDIIPQSARVFRAMKPFLDYLNGVIEPAIAEL